MNKYIELARKLKALADQGSGGEKYNAQKALDRLMKKHGISMEEIELPERHMVEFKVSRQKRNFFAQVAMSVIGHKRDLRIMPRKPTLIFGEVSRFEEIEIRAKFEYFWRLWIKEQDIFLHAFIMKNRIFDIDAESKQLSDLSPEDQEKARRAMAMTEAIERGEYLKQLS